MLDRQQNRISNEPEQSAAPRPLKMSQDAELRDSVLKRLKDDFGYDDLQLARASRNESHMEAACRNEAAARFPDSDVAWEQWVQEKWHFPNPTHDMGRSDDDRMDDWYRGVWTRVPSEFVSKAAPLIDKYFSTRKYVEHGRRHADRNDSDLKFDEPYGVYHNSEVLMPIEDVSAKIMLIHTLWELSESNSRFDLVWTGTMLEKYEPLWGMRDSKYNDAKTWFHYVRSILRESNEALEKNLITATQQSDYLSQIGLMDLGSLLQLLSEKLGRGNPNNQSVRQTNRLSSTL